MPELSAARVAMQLLLPLGCGPAGRGSMAVGGAAARPELIAGDLYQARHVRLYVRPPKEFPTSRWATLEQLVLQLEPYAPEEVARIGPQNLRQLITEWYKGHPAFAGLAYSAWGKRLKDMHPLAHPRSLTYKVRSWPSPHRLALSTHVRALCSAAVLLRTHSRTRRSSPL